MHTSLPHYTRHVSLTNGRCVKDLFSCSFVQKTLFESIVNFQDLRTYSPTCKDRLIIVKFELSTPNTPGSENVGKG